MPHKLHNVVSQRSNPRSKEYMLELLHKRFPDAELVDMTSSTESGRILLLYPDAIGLGWRGLEKTLLRRFSHVSVLNGRNRYFELNYATLTRLRVKRLLEKTFLPELLFAPILIIMGVIWAAKDKITGRL